MTGPRGASLLAWLARVPMISVEERAGLGGGQAGDRRAVRGAAGGSCGAVCPAL